MKKISIFFGLLAVLGAGCKKSFLDVNENPNTTTSAPAINVFTGALSTTANAMTGPHALGGAWTGIFGFSTSFTGGGAEKTYVFSNANFDYWGGLYDNINDYNYVINNAAKEGSAWLAGPAIVMRSLQFQKLVDLYGNVPYSEAFDLTNVTPSYDKGQAVYEDLIKKLDSAIVIMKAATFPTATQDILFRGNKTNWIKLANTLKLRILVRQDKIAGRAGYLTGEVNKIVAEGSGFLTTNALLNPGYAKELGKLNPFYSTFGYNENDVATTNFRFYKMNSFIINTLKATQDTFRLQRKAAMKAQGNNGNVNDFTNYVGVGLGATGAGFTETVVSSIGSALIVRGEATRPMVMFTAAESYFLQAEAALPTAQGGLGVAALGNPKTLYENGVIESFKLDAGNGTSATPTATVAVATAAAQRYLANGLNNVSYDASTNKMEAIITQKWLALALYDNLEAWTEWRRTGYPAVPLSTQAGNATQPRRLYYPISEQNTNLENMRAEGTINVYTGRIFWDVR